MNLLIITPVLGATTETFITNHILNLPDILTFVITSKVEKLLIPKNRVLEISLKYGPATFDKEIKKLVSDFIKINKITAILIEYGTYGSEIIDLNYSKFKLPIYVHFHGYDISQALNNNLILEYYKIFHKYIDGIITVSYSMSKRLINLGIPKEKIFVNYYGTNHQNIYKLKNQNSIIKLLFVGRLVNKKNPIVIIKAVENILKIHPFINLTIIGEGYLRENIENYIKNKNLQNTIQLLGELPNEIVHDYFLKSNIYLQNSCIDNETGDREGTPVSIIEAMSYGLPIISTNHEGISEIIINNFNGILVNENDVASFSKYLDILIKDKDFREYLGNNAKITHNLRLNYHYTNKRLKDYLTGINFYKNKPFFSICIPTYNRGLYLRDAIKSILLQNFDNYEVIIVDDGSDDNTKEIVNNFQDIRIKYFYKSHTNAPDTRNYAISNAKGKYIIWLDSDDVMLPNTLMNYYLEINKNSEINLLYGDLIITDANLLPQKELNYIDWNNKNQILLSNLFNGNFIPNSTVCIQKDIYEAFGNYNIEFSRAHDYEFWTRIVKYVKIKKVNQKNCFWRWHSTNLSAENKQIDVSYEINIVKNMLKNYSLEEIFYDLNWSNRTDALVKAYLKIVKRFIILKDFTSALYYANLGYKLNPSEEIYSLIEQLKNVDIL